MDSKSKVAKTAKTTVTAKVRKAVVVPETKVAIKSARTKVSFNKKKVLLSILWVVVFFVAFALVDLFVQYQNNDASVAVVNGERIYKDEFYTMLEDYNLDQVLQGIILEKAIYQEAAKENIVVTEEEIDSYLQKFFIDRIGSKEDFIAMLKQSGKNYNLFRRDMKVQIIEVKKFPYTDQDLQAYFEQNKSTFVTDPTSAADPVYSDVKLDVEYSYITNVIANDKGAQWITDIQTKSVVQDNLTSKPSYELFKQTRNLINGLLNKTTTK